jgi:ribonucleoside-diphosphate reductase alpha chain
MTPFKDYYQEFIYKSRYSRWLEEEGRRENWDETVNRYLDFIFNRVEPLGSIGVDKSLEENDLYQELYDAIYNLEVLPSMRTIMTAGPAAERDNTCTYNCSYLPIDDIKSFDEAMFILLCGTGVGFSVERQYISKLPEVPAKLFESDTTIVVKDSKEGWAKSLRQLISLLYAGEISKWDVSRIRPAGARLKTFGGRASGPGPLEDLFKFVIGKFREAQGRRLNSIECHDILCKIGEIVVVGGVRRSAMISLSNLDDLFLAKAKSIFDVDQYNLINETETHWVYTITMKKSPSVSPTYKISLSKEKEKWDREQLEKNKKIGWWIVEPQRALSNNSIAYTEKPDVGAFMNEWVSLYESKSGERGIFNRVASQRQANKNGRRKSEVDFGTNPCSEIILRPYQFCNLTEVVVRSKDTFESLSRKVRFAAILGTFQSTLTYFPYLRKIWQQNTEEERLLGVSLTGQMDNEDLVQGRIDLEALKQIAIDTNKEWAALLGIPASAAITCVKPSGTVSQLVDAASGLHARHSSYYIRSVRGDNKDPLTQFMKDAGIPWEPEVNKPDQTSVFYFPIKSPEGSVKRNDMDAIQQLEYWKYIQDKWCEHKPSITVSVREEEWPAVGGWVYGNFDIISGISFLPHSDHVYRQAPYQECSKEEYEAMVAKMPKEINWELLSEYEKEDHTSGMQMLACSSDAGCEVVDIL